MSNLAIFLSEIDSDTSGTDRAEFIELSDGGVGNTPLDGLVVVLFNGNSDTVYAAIDLTGYSSRSDGYFVIGNGGVAGADLIIDDNSLQNGADAVALYLGSAADFPSGTPLQTEGLLDAIVYDTDDADDGELLGLLQALNRAPLQINENVSGAKDEQSIQRVGADEWAVLAPTPGAENTLPVPFLPQLTATLTDELLVDADDSGNASPGDTLRYTALFTSENGATEAVELALTPPTGTALVLGSVTTTQGTVVAGNAANDTNVVVSLGSVDATASVSFDLQIGADAPKAIQLQGAITSALGSQLSDDPDIAGDADPTQTPIVPIPAAEEPSDEPADDSIPGTFFSYQQTLQLAGQPQPAAVEIGNLTVSALVDEAYYLYQNADVATAVASGLFASGYEHFLRYGWLEGRSPSALYDETLYLESNADVAAAVISGVFRSGFEHFAWHGHQEQRQASQLFDETAYLNAHGDVAAAVAQGLLGSGFEHLIEYGLAEGRLPKVALFDAAYYLNENADVAAAVAAQTLPSGLEHYGTFGQGEGRSPSAQFSEADYLALHGDVAMAVGAGELASGFAHYVNFGRFEGRDTLLA